MRSRLTPIVPAALALLIGCAGPPEAPPAQLVEQEAVAPEVKNTSDGLRFKWVVGGSGHLFIKPPTPVSEATPAPAMACARAP